MPRRRNNRFAFPPNNPLMAGAAAGSFGRPAVPLPISIKAPEIKTAALSECYQWTKHNLEIALGLALDWYAENMSALLFGAPLDADDTRRHAQAKKAYERALSTDQTGERQTSLRTAVKQYERIWASKHALPRFDEANPPERGKGIASIIKTLDSLNGAYNPLGLTFHPTLKPDRHFELGSGIVEIPIAELSNMAAASPLGVVFSEFTAAIKAVSMAKRMDGTMGIDGNKLLSNSIPDALKYILSWSESIGNREVFKTGRRVKGLATAPKPIHQKGTVAAPRHSKMTVANPFQAGSVKDKLWQLIKDGGMVKMEDLHDICTVNKTKFGLINNVAKRLRQLGFTVNKSKRYIEVIKP